MTNRYQTSMLPTWFFCLAAFGLLAGSATAQQSSEQPASEGDRLFALRVRPLLTEKCAGCHGGDTEDVKGEYDIMSSEALMRGGESGEPAIVPGKPEESPFYRAITWEELEMPPKENDRLTEQQVQWVRRWIELGAPWPSDETQQAIRQAQWKVTENEEGVIITTSGGLANDWTYRRYNKEDVWAFQPLKEEFAHDSIDSFIGAKLTEKGIAAAPEASPQQLLRRAYYDLLGLPPTPQQAEEFLSAWQQDASSAWEDLIDELLASPHYGERAAQHWLDVVRYADTGGLSNDYERSNAWRYRDYVVRAFIADKPFDRFIVEQIAGDELPDATVESRIATGFLRMGPWDTAMIPQEEARQIFRDDLVHNVGQSFLGMPMRCCKCHDHKFDPIPTQDYYRIYAAFSATQPAEMEAPFLPEENLSALADGDQHVKKMHQFADSRRLALLEKQEAAAKAWYAERGLEYKDLEARKNDADDQKPPRYAGLDETEKGRLKVREQDEWIWARRKERYQPMIQTVYNGPDKHQNARKLRAPANGKIDMDWRPETFILLGGALSGKSSPVAPGVLSACGLAAPSAAQEDPFALTTDIEGRRLGLAKWIANADNPLTPRVIVNRIWQSHFGSGIVATSNNFGAKGSKPSHPELLDWLAQDFLAGGWKIKRLHKKIMLSQAYRRSTRHPDLDELQKVDPDRRLLAVFSPRRLTAEEIRDSLLAVSGELNREVGGLPAMPEINMEVALQPRMIQFSIAPAHQPSPTPELRNRRSLYAYRVRGQADPFLEILNQPNPNESCEVRDAAAVSPQAFTLLNSDVMTDRSIALALHVQQESKRLRAQIRRAFSLTLLRTPTGQELESLVKYAREMREYHRQHEPEKVVYPTSITRSLVEEFSGDIFEYEEILPVFQDYIPDAKPHAVSPNVRALADVCLLLVNANEFIYVY